MSHHRGGRDVCVPAHLNLCYHVIMQHNSFSCYVFLHYIPYHIHPIPFFSCSSPFSLIPTLFLFPVHLSLFPHSIPVTQWDAWVLCAGKWERIYVQEHGLLSSGHCTEGKASPSQVSHTYHHIFMDGLRASEKIIQKSWPFNRPFISKFWVVTCLYFYCCPLQNRVFLTEEQAHQSIGLS